MRHAYLTFFVAACIAAPAMSQNTEIESVIRSQIDAFLADDMDLAFTYVSPDAQTMFGTAEMFGQVIKSGYPMVYRASDVQMQELYEASGSQWQRVRMIDTQGVPWLVDFMMVETPAGWKISTVLLLPATDTGN